MTTAARRPFPAAQPPVRRVTKLVGLSAALHATVLVALLSRAAVPPPEPLQRAVSLVWDSATEGAHREDATAAPPAPPPQIAAPAAPEAASPPAAPPAVPAAPPAPPAAAQPPREALPAPPVPALPPPATPPPGIAAPAPPLPVAPAGDVPPAPPQLARPILPPQPSATTPDPAPAPPAPPMELAARPVPPPPPPAPPTEAAPPVPRPAPRPPPRQAAASPQRQTWSPPTRGEAPAEAALAAGGVARGAVVPPRPSASAANPSPSYPLASRRRGEEGRVTLLVQVDPSGRVLDLAVLGSSGHPALDEEAARTVRRWRFEPATQDGLAVFSTATVGITFRLEGERRW